MRPRGTQADRADVGELPDDSGSAPSDRPASASASLSASIDETALSQSLPFEPIDIAHALDTNSSTDWLRDNPFDDAGFADAFIPGLWDFSPSSLHAPPLPTPRPFDARPDATRDEADDEASNANPDFEHPWPMEWNPGSAQPLSLPRLERPPHYKPTARSMFCGKLITDSDIRTWKDRIKGYFGHGPWQPIHIDHFPSSESLNHAVDMYFVHFHAVSNTRMDAHNATLT